MRIAVIGIRGVPAAYSGLETEVDEVGSRLVARGHELLVYCRRGSSDYSGSHYKGMRRIVLPSLKGKRTDTYSHSLLCMLHVLKERPDVVLAYNPGIASLCIIPKLCGYPVALNPDGFDWERGKWGWFAKRFIRASAWLTTKVVDQIIADAITVQTYFNSVWRCQPPAVYIPNGGQLEPSETACIPEAETAAILARYGVEKGHYILFLSRHERENSCEYIIKAFEGVAGDVKLLFGGGVTYASAYADALRQTKDPRILFPGPIYDPLHVKALHHNCLFVVHGNQPGGMSLGLLKAMGLGACVMTVNTPDNAYVLQDAGVTYELSVESIRSTMKFLLANPSEVREFQKKAVARIKQEYLWDVVTDRYEAVLSRLATKNGSSSPTPRN
jgi:glycosyltransferase involved in cell wall biosynthesis